MAKATFRVTAEHGRVKRTLPDGSRVLVAIPGDEIPVWLAAECGLTEPAPAPPANEALKEVVKAVSKRASYPIKKSRK